MKIVFRLGYVGVKVTACLLKDGRSVVGVDVARVKAAKIEAGQSPVSNRVWENFWRRGEDRRLNVAMDVGAISTTQISRHRLLMTGFVRRRVIALLSQMMSVRSLTRHRHCWVIWRAPHPSRKRDGAMSVIMDVVSSFPEARGLHDRFVGGYRGFPKCAIQWGRRIIHGSQRLF